MAASKELSRSVLHGSAELVDFPCTICQTRNQHDVKSHKYCVDCDSNLCPACTTYHTSFPTMESHHVVDVSQASGTHKPLLPTQRCGQHQGKIIDKYCDDHAEAACEICISLYHSNCTKCKSIPKIAQGISKTNSLQVVQTSTDTLIKALKLKKSSQQDVLQQLDEEETQTQRDVDALCTRLHQHIDSLAQSESAKISSEYQSKRVAFKKDLKEVDEKIDVAETLKTKLYQAKSDNESELFVSIKQGEKNEKEGNQLLQTLGKPESQIPTYRLSSNIEKSLKGVKSLGDFKKVVTVAVKLQKEINVKHASDKSNCNIRNICFLPDESMIILDNSNNKLKKLDPSYKIIQQIDLKANLLYDVCFINKTNEVAVTIPVEKKVQFVKADTTMKKTSMFLVGEKCGGICYDDDELYICCGELGTTKGNKVQVFSLSGRPLRTIQHDQAGKPILPSMSYIIVSACGSKLYISGDTGITTIDKSGTQLAAIKEPRVKYATGMCVLDNGDLLVCSWGSNSLVHVSEDGRRLNTLIGLRIQLAMSLDRDHSRLILSTKDSDYMKLYNIQIN